MLKIRSCFMDHLNNIYNFKNPIRHFFNLDNIKFDVSESFKFKDLTWTAPVKFKIFKTENSQRVISFPNILNFYHAIKLFQKEDNFWDIKSMSMKNRVSPDLDTGEFSVLSYYNAVQQDAFNLTKFDKLMILDIKSFYGRIYTHDLKFVGDDNLEQRASSLNRGRTNGLLLGSYLSLFLAEKVLLDIEERLDEELKLHGIQCHYEYFSDDFYFFCNNSDIKKITDIFSAVLEEYDLQVNHEKTTIEDFEEYTKKNNLEKLWKKIINMSSAKDERIKFAKHITRECDNHPVLFTQLVYRLSQIPELKYKRIFLANFFKTQYFYELDPSLYTLSQSDLNYICYIYKLMPETILYSLPHVMGMKGFKLSIFKEFVLSRFRAVLQTEKQEEQVYFYYAIKLCKFDEDLVNFKEMVLKSKNQILISYLVMDKIIQEADYSEYIGSPQESDWLQNYHYLLTYDKSKTDILLPHRAKDNQKCSYTNFYKRNLDAGIPILKPIDEIYPGVRKFIKNKIESY